MRYGIISDIHGNTEAFKAVLDACQNDGVRSIVCLGDIVGYGADPSECIDIVRQTRMPVVAGNHDWAVCGKVDCTSFKGSTQASVRWTHEQLSVEEKQYLSEMELIYVADDFIAVHGSLHQPHKFHYLKDSVHANDSFFLMDKPLLFVGHTHVPQVFIKEGDLVNISDKTQFEINTKHKTIVNVGSVGQPRDSNPHACFCIFDPDLNRIEIKRVAYDISSAQKKIRSAGLPNFLAERIGVGE